MMIIGQVILNVALAYVGIFNMEGKVILCSAATSSFVLQTSGALCEMPRYQKHIPQTGVANIQWNLYKLDTLALFY